MKIVDFTLIKVKIEVKIYHWKLTNLDHIDLMERKF